MQKIIAVLFIFVFIIFLSGCYESEDNYFSLDEVIFDTENYYSGLPAKPMSVVVMYAESKYNFSIYECKKTDNYKIIAGYLDLDIIRLLDNIDIELEESLGRTYSVSGIDRYMVKYQYAVKDGFIDKNEYPVRCKYVSDNDLSLIYKEQRLVFVLREYTIASKNISNDLNSEFKMYDTVYGNIKNGIFHYDLSHNPETSLDHFLFSVYESNDFYMERKVEQNSIIIYEEMYVIASNYQIDDYRLAEEFYQAVEKAIISEEQESIDRVLYKYDYKEIIKILKGK